jgi:hypothetical protein
VARTVSQRALVGLLAAALLVVPGTALAGPNSSGGPWDFTVTAGGQPVTCTFSGKHWTDSKAFAQTSRNSVCDRVRVRMKWNHDGSVVTSNWIEDSLGSVTLVTHEAATAISSEHRARHQWNVQWSTVRRPHAW